VLKEKFRFLLLSLLLLVTLGTVGFYIYEQNQNKLTSCIPEDYLGEYDEDAKTAYYEGKEISVPKFAEAESETSVLGTASPNEKWIEVDLSEQKLRAWDGNSLFLETSVSTGLPWWPTPKGEFRIWIKLRYTSMEGGEGKYYYNLPNVPYVMFFENESVPGWRGYGLHGTYWHNAFGTRRSHGCVNLPTDIAGQLFYWTTPTIKDGAWTVFSSDENPGTRIVIHE
jgi:lipoprotein-anchoring transpeptidase ErfK/SrfK